SASGAAVGAAVVWAAARLPDALAPPPVPLTAPELPLWPAAAVLAGLLPAFVAPVPALRTETDAGSVSRTGQTPPAKETTRA
ncbi:energy-coupling factor transporter transmembrane protein EcfT, partial [Streptomyces chitinivorans]